MTARKISVHEDRFDTKGVTIAFTAPTPHDPKLVLGVRGPPGPRPVPPDRRSRASPRHGLSAPTAPCGSSASTLGRARDEFGVWGGVLLENGNPRSAVPRRGRPPKVGSAA